MEPGQLVRGRIGTLVRTRVLGGGYCHDFTVGDAATAAVSAFPALKRPTRELNIIGRHVTVTWSVRTFAYVYKACASAWGQ